MILLALGACRAPGSQAADLRSTDPAARIRAIKLAGDRRDQAALPLLVPQLEDDDSAVRFYAILAIEKITGTRLGYNYADPPAERARAVKRWRSYLRTLSAAASQPTSATTTRGADSP